MSGTGAPGRVRRSLSGIRARVLVGYVVLLAIALGIAVLVTRQVLMTRLDRSIDRALAQEVDELRALVGGTDPATGEPFGADVRAILDTFLRRSVPADNEAFYTIVDGEPWLRSFEAPAEVLEDEQVVAAWAAARQPLRLSVDTAVGNARTLTVPLRLDDEVLGAFVVAYFPAEDRAEIDQTVRVIAVAGLVVLLISAGVAWTLAGRVLRPVRELTSTARAITEADLSARIPVAGDDELAELGHTFNDMLDRLESGARNQRQFLDDVAHELRTPITIARGHLEVLGDDPVERADTIAVVTDELDRMGRYVSDLLLIAKAEQPDFLRLEPVDLGELAESLLQRAEMIADRHWVCDAAPPLGRTAVVVDDERLVQAVLNLLTNAVDHTADGDEIGIGVERRGDTLVVWVRDTGPGIDPALGEAMFTRLVRGATSRSGREDGMGIGLAIVDAVARAHGGRVTVDSAPGRGATFTISLPADPYHDSEETT